MNIQKNFAIGGTIKEAWASTMDNLPFLVGVTAVVMGFAIITQTFQGLLQENWLAVGLLVLVTFVISTIFKLGMLRIMLKVTNAEKPSWGDLIQERSLFFHYLFASILVAIIVFVGFVLLIIPGIIFALALSFFGLSMVDKNLGITEALRHSWNLTKGMRLKLLGLFITLGVINLVGLLALGVGLLVTVPLSMVAQAIVYRKLSSAGEMLPLENPSPVNA